MHMPEAHKPGGSRKYVCDGFTLSAHAFTKYGPRALHSSAKKTPMELVVLALASNERYISRLLLTVKGPDKEMSELRRPS